MTSESLGNSLGSSLASSLGNLLAVPFEGRRKYSDFIDKPTIVYPWSDAALCQAIRLKHLGQKGFLRSGLSSSGDGPLQGDGGIVVDFSGFARIAVRKTGRDGDGRIAIDVEAGATTRQLADELIRNDAFLPLGDNRSRAWSPACSPAGPAASTAAWAVCAAMSKASR
jgi:hypothetical protein